MNSKSTDSNFIFQILFIIQLYALHFKQILSLHQIPRNQISQNKRSFYRMKFIHLFFCYILVRFVASQNCGSPQSSDQIQSGIHTLQRQNPNNPRLHNYNIPIDAFQVTDTGFDVAVSTSSINGYNPTNGFDYKINGGKQIRGISLVLTVHIKEDQKWATIKISYLASNFNDLILGSFIGDPFYSSNSPDYPNGIGIVEEYIPTQRFKSKYSYAINTFISGLRIQNSMFNVYLINNEIDKNQGRIIVQFQTNAQMGLEMLQITYAIYPINHETFSFDSPSDGIYYLIGAQKFLNLDVSTKKLSICKFPYQVCTNGQVFFQGICQCPPGTIFINNNCAILCGPNAYFNNQKRCICIPGHQFTFQGICVKQTNCGSNQMIVASDRCDCKEGYFRDMNGICQQNCRQNQAFNGFKCLCQNGFFRNSEGVCQIIPLCPSNSIFMMNSGLCECQNGFIKDKQQNCVKNTKCGINQVLINGKCECSSTFFRHSNGLCYQIPNCTTNAQLNRQTAQCECKEGFFMNGKGSCIKLENCQQNQIFNPSIGKCECVSSYSLDMNGKCAKQISCSQNQRFSLQLNVCECLPGFIRMGLICVNQCGLNEKWINQECVCRQGTAKIRGTCRQCPLNSDPNNAQNSCLCKIQGLFFNINSFQCQQCPQNSTPNQQLTECICNSGYTKNIGSNKCELLLNCPDNSSLDQYGNCKCNSGFYLDEDSCRPQPACPSRSQWNLQTFSCKCVDQNQHLANGQCRNCSQNQIWDGQSCVCRPQFFRIDGICRGCDPRAVYNGVDCICKTGFYGNRDLCQLCHFTCSQCTGPQANQCRACIDISYTLQNGYCTQSQSCQIGTYLSPEGICQPCMEYCRQCNTHQACNQCAPGFELISQTYDNQVYQFCYPICGDGKKNAEQQCDDGNESNNDGCNVQCEVEDGWFCSDGTSIKQSICTTKRPLKSEITVEGAVNMVGRVLQSIRLSFIPQCFTDNNCVDCYQILKISVTSSLVPIRTLINYIPNSDGQFLVEFKFPAIALTSAFTFNIRINNDLPRQYSGCFTEQDLEQSITTTVDPALLIIAEEFENDQILTIDDLKQSSGNIDNKEQALELLNSSA